MFSNHYGVRRCNIIKMLASFNLEFEGNQHCGLDDAKNIARILLRLAADGCDIKINSNLKKCLIQIEKSSTQANEEKLAHVSDSEPSVADSLDFAEE